MRLIATPMLRGDDAVYAVDLWLDVLVRSDGVTHGVYDQDEFDDALERGWLSDREATAARSGLRDLLELRWISGRHPSLWSHIGPTGARHAARSAERGRGDPCAGNSSVLVKIRSTDGRLSDDPVLGDPEGPARPRIAAAARALDA
jgi:hypothetical protein